MAEYRITPLHVGTITRKKSNMLYRCGSDAPTEFPLIAFLLEGEGHRYVIDTGGSRPGDKWMPYVRPAEQEIDEQLRRCGTEPKEIEAVLFTHLHWDHAGNNASFPNARFYVQRAEYEPISKEALPGFERELVMANAYELIDGDMENVLPGISVLLTPGHSLGSQTIVVNTPEGKTAVVGDLIPTYENIELGIPNGGNYDIDIITRSMRRVLALGYRILPGHDLGAGR